MRRNRIYKIFTVVFMMAILASCYETEVSPTIDPGDYPTASFTYEVGSSVSEGDQLVFAIKLDKPLQWDVAFEFVLDEELSTVSADDYSVSGGSIPAFKTEGEMVVTFNSENIVEETERIVFAVEIDHSLATKYLLNPETEYPSVDVEVKSVNAADALTVNCGWTDADASDPNDFDMFLFNVDGGQSVIWDAAATGDNPEVFVEAMTAEGLPDGKYYVGIDVWHAGASETVVPLTFGMGFADQSVKFHTGEFNVADMSKYAIDSFPAWGVGAKRIFEINKSGNNISGKFLAQ